jgi:hypothetical protein
MPSSADLFPHLVLRCPNLNTLQLQFPKIFQPGPEDSNWEVRKWEDNDEKEPYDPTTLFLSKFLPPVHSQLPQLHRLCDLDVAGPFVFQPGTLLILGELPLIESLSLRDRDSGRRKYFHYDLPAEAFPRLKRLELQACNQLIAMASLCDTRPLVRNLLKIMIDISDARWDQGETDAIIFPCLQSLKRLSPQLVDLELIILRWSLFQTKIFIALGVFSLTRFSLDKADMGHGGRIDRLTRALCGLEELSLASTATSYQGFSAITKNMPRLRFLKLGYLGVNDFNRSSIPGFDSSASGHDHSKANSGGTQFRHTRLDCDTLGIKPDDNEHARNVAK